MKTETQEFSQWYAEEVKKGLVDVKFTPGHGIDKDTTKEDFTAENNRVNRLINSGNVVMRADVF